MKRTITLPTEQAKDFLKAADAADLIDAIDAMWQMVQIAAEPSETEQGAYDIQVSAPTGVMVAWMLPEWVARMLAVPGGEPMESLHLTLAYLGDASALSADDSRKLVGIVGEVCNRHIALSGTVNGFGRFTAKEGADVEPLWVGVNLPGLQELRADLVDALTTAGLPVSTEFDFAPHITVAYVPVDAPTPSVTVAPLDIALNSLTVAVGGAHYTLDLVENSEDWPASDYVATAYLPDLTKSVGQAPADRYTLGPWYVPNQIDAHGEWSDPDSLQKALWGYVESGDRDIRLQHDRSIVAGRWVEAMSWPFEVEVPLTKADGTVTKYKYPAGTPFLGVQWEPWAWELVEKGLLRGYSIGGKSDRVLVDLPTE